MPRKPKAVVVRLVLEAEDATVVHAALLSWKNSAHLEGCDCRYEAWMEEIIQQVEVAMSDAK